MDQPHLRLVGGVVSRVYEVLLVVGWNMRFVRARISLRTAVPVSRVRFFQDATPFVPTGAVAAKCEGELHACVYGKGC